MKAVIIDFKKSKLIKREVGKHCTVYHFYFFIVWFVDKNLLDMLKQARENGIKEGQKIFKN
jgi:hypothetical protein